MNSSAASAGRVVIAAGSGFLGQNLARYLMHGGSEVVVLGAEALINLVGRSVD